MQVFRTTPINIILDNTFADKFGSILQIKMKNREVITASISKVTLQANSKTKIIFTILVPALVISDPKPNTVK